jgi:hypothetical protein
VREDLRHIRRKVKGFDVTNSLPRFEHAARRRPVSLIGTVLVQTSGATSAAPCSLSAPSGAVVATGIGPITRVSWRSGADLLEAVYAEGRVAIAVTTAGRTTLHRSRRFGRVPPRPEGLALVLTGTQLTALTAADGVWTARARVDLRGHVDTRAEAWLAALEVGHDGPVDQLEAGTFGQLGLRDLRAVSHEDGTPYRLADGRLALSATSAGPGFFDTAHTSFWALDPGSLELEHLSDLFFRRPDRPGVYGDHATHLVRTATEPGWLVATSTWGDFDARRADASVGVTVARTDADLLAGTHVLDTVDLHLPTDGFRSVGVWDPHLVHTGEEWLVGYVSARRFFRFHPVLAGGPSLDALTLRGADTRRRATEGTTVVSTGSTTGPGSTTGAASSTGGQGWAVLASDGRDGTRGRRARYPVYDLRMNEVGVLDAPYPTNIPWPTLIRVDEDCMLLVGFDGTPYGAAAGAGSGQRLLGYGTHGDVVIARSVAS